MHFKAIRIILSIPVLVCSFLYGCKNDDPEETEPVQKWNAEHRNHVDVAYNYKILDMSFASESVGWAIGDANWSLFRFNGRHWELFSSEIGWDGGLSAVCTVNDSLIFIASQMGRLQDSSGKDLTGMCIQRSGDAGSSWQVVYNQTDADIRVTKLFFVNDSVGYGLKGHPAARPGINTVVLRTRDGGETWDNPLVDRGGDNWLFTDIHFTDEEHGILCGTTGLAGMIFTTDDGGTTWTRRYLPDASFEDLTNIEVVDVNRIYASSAKFLYRSDDGGRNWITVSDFSKLPYIHENLFTEFISADVGYAFGTGTGPIEDNYCSDLLRTEDGGKTWTRLYLNRLAKSRGGIDNFIAPDAAYIWPNTQDVWTYGHAVDPVNSTNTIIGYFGQLFFFQSWN